MNYQIPFGYNPFGAWLDKNFPGWKDDDDLFWLGFDAWVVQGEASRYQKVLPL